MGVVCAVGRALCAASSSSHRALRRSRTTRGAPRACCTTRVLHLALCTTRGAPRASYQQKLRPGSPGGTATNKSPGAHPFIRAGTVGARACRPFCTTHRGAPRCTAHHAPRATLRHARRTGNCTYLGHGRLGALLAKNDRALTRFFDLYSSARGRVVHFAPRTAVHRAAPRTARHAPRCATRRPSYQQKLRPGSPGGTAG